MFRRFETTEPNKWKCFISYHSMTIEQTAIQTGGMDRTEPHHNDNILAGERDRARERKRIHEWKNEPRIASISEMSIIHLKFNIYFTRSNHRSYSTKWHRQDTKHIDEPASMYRGGDKRIIDTKPFISFKMHINDGTLCWTTYPSVYEWSSNPPLHKFSVEKEKKTAGELTVQA